MTIRGLPFDLGDVIGDIDGDGSCGDEANINNVDGEDGGEDEGSEEEKGGGEVESRVDESGGVFSDFECMSAKSCNLSSVF